MVPVKVDQSSGPDLRAKIIGKSPYDFPYVVIYEVAGNHVAYIDGRDMTRLAKAWLKAVGKPITQPPE